MAATSRRKSNLLDIMSEQLAQSLDPTAPPPPPVDVVSDDHQLEFAAAAEDDDDAFALDLALALQLQEEEDALFVSQLPPASHRPQGNVTLKPLLCPILPKIKSSLALAGDDDDDEETAPLPLPFPLTRDKSLKGQGGEGEIITKHDLVRSQKKNALSLDKFVPANQCGTGMAQQRLSNAAYNSLSQQVKRQQHRAMAPSTSSAAASNDDGHYGKGLDRRTTRILQSLVNSELIDHVGGLMRTGKEANVFYCADRAKQLEFAVKIYKQQQPDSGGGEFSNRAEYIEGDHRFADVSVRRLPEDKLTLVWAEKELKNLCRLRDAGLPAPRPVRLVKHVLVMDFVRGGGGGSGAAGQLAEMKSSQSWWTPDMRRTRQACLLQCLLLMRALWQRCSLVHADFSEYNVLVQGAQGEEVRCVLVDVGQAVDLTHPRCGFYLERDVRNILRFFRVKGGGEGGGGGDEEHEEEELVLRLASWVRGEQEQRNDLEEDKEDTAYWVEYARDLGPWADAESVRGIVAWVISRRV